MDIETQLLLISAISGAGIGAAITGTLYILIGNYLASRPKRHKGQYPKRLIELNSFRYDYDR